MVLGCRTIVSCSRLILIVFDHVYERSRCNISLWSVHVFILSKLIGDNLYPKQLNCDGASVADQLFIIFIHATIVNLIKAFDVKLSLLLWRDHLKSMIRSHRQNILKVKLAEY